MDQTVKFIVIGEDVAPLSPRWWDALTGFVCGSFIGLACLPHPGYGLARALAVTLCENVRDRKASVLGRASGTGADWIGLGVSLIAVWVVPQRILEHLAATALPGVWAWSYLVSRIGWLCAHVARGLRPGLRQLATEAGCAVGVAAAMAWVPGRF